MLELHTRSFYWTEDNYSVFRNKSERTFYTAAAKLALNNPERMLREELAHQRQNRTKKALLQQSLSRRPRLLIALSDILSESTDERKATTFRMALVWFTVLRETARRTGIPQQELRYLMNPELKTLLLTGRVDRSLLKQRLKRCIVVLSANGWRVYTGSSIRNTTATTFEKSSRRVSTVRGVSASPGLARGIVRIVRKHHEIRLVRPGEILVTNNTTPDYVQAMHRAAAIVTEQGGITNHAAIVSRELRKPCVIGTKIATRVFKTGDRVEVDATRGTVRKI
jgi:phosphohistidine swiveling domain-containing protein